MGEEALPHEATGEYSSTFTFGSGETLALRTHYSTLGTLRRDAHGSAMNAVLVLHGTTGSGSSFLKGKARQSFAVPLFGTGGPLDAREHYIILPDGIGHGQSSRPSDGLRCSFPKYDYDDMVRAHHDLLTKHLGVDHLLLVMGTSMGGMQTWVHGIRYPNFMDALFPLASNPVAIAGINRMVRKAIVDAIREDPGFASGQYPTGIQLHGQKCAVRMMAVRMSSSPLQWYRQAPTRIEAETMLDTITAQQMATHDPCDMIYAFEASRNYNPDPDLCSIIAPLTAVNTADDQVNPPELQVLERGVERMRKSGRDAKAILIPISEETRGHGSHTIAALWQKDLVDLLRRARHAHPCTYPAIESNLNGETMQSAKGPRGLRKILSTRLSPMLFGPCGHVDD